jgi:parvulin-like peptidyl-prolyl isomerase
VLADVSALGDAPLQPPACTNEPQRSVEASFGKEFTAEVFRLPLGEWRGPLRSGLGVHLVVVQARSEGRVPALAEVRDAVEREWASERRQNATRKFVDDLLKQYQVTLPWPKPGQKAAAPNP